MIQKSPYQILIRPVITEKALHGTDSDHAQYTFEVDYRANKREIKWAVETAYGVSVKNVNTVTTKGKMRNMRARPGAGGKKPDVKKAFVTLAEGQQIELM